MEEKISTIKKIELKKENIISMIMFDKSLGGTDLKFLEEEFDIYKDEIEKFAECYKNIGIVLNLTPINEELLKDWKIFIRKVIKKSYEFDKFNNIRVGKNYDKILLITNKRLLKVDLSKLNEKIEEINYRIESYDERIEAEMKELAKTAKEEHKGIFGRLIEALKR